MLIQGGCFTSVIGINYNYLFVIFLIQFHLISVYNPYLHLSEKDGLFLILGKNQTKGYP